MVKNFCPRPRRKNISYNERIGCLGSSTIDKVINRTRVDRFIHPFISFLLFFARKGEIYIPKESDFKGKLYKEIRERFPGSEVVINDPNYIQGFPDASVYFPNGRYMLLEGKRNFKAKRQPNQDYYVNKSPLSKNAMFVSPENKDEVMRELERRYKSDI